MGIEKTLLLAHESIYWINISTNMENAIRNFPICLDFQGTQQKDKMLLHEMQGKLWESVGADIFTINNKHSLCIVDYHNRFPVIKQVKGLCADHLMKVC